MKKTIFLILLGIILGFSSSVIARNITSWHPSIYQTDTVQIWCELRVKRGGWENYCKWTGKYWELTCLGVERLFVYRIEPINGNYGCED